MCFKGIKSEMVKRHIKGGGVRADVPFGTKKMVFLLKASLIIRNTLIHLYFFPTCVTFYSFVDFQTAYLTRLKIRIKDGLRSCKVNREQMENKIAT